MQHGLEKWRSGLGAWRECCSSRFLTLLPDDGTLYPNRIPTLVRRSRNGKPVFIEPNIAVKRQGDRDIKLDPALPLFITRAAPSDADISIDDGNSCLSCCTAIEPDGRSNADQEVKLDDGCGPICFVVDTPHLGIDEPSIRQALSVTNTSDDVIERLSHKCPQPQTRLVAKGSFFTRDGRPYRVDPFPNSRHQRTFHIVVDTDTNMFVQSHTPK